VEKVQAEPDVDAGGGRVWEDEVSPDFMALHFRARDLAAAAPPPVGAVRALARRASEVALRRASVLPPAVALDDSWLAHSQAPASVPASRSHTPMLPHSPPAIVVSEEDEEEDGA
jgi:hypothetical protein